MPAFKNPTVLISASAGKGHRRVRAALRCLGDDAVVTVWGGSDPHVGSIAVAQPRPSMRDPAMLSVTSSVHNLIGHKDEAVARSFAEKIASSCGKTTVAVAGMHIDDASEADIVALLANAETVCTLIIKKLGYEKQ